LWYNIIDKIKDNYDVAERRDKMRIYIRDLKREIQDEVIEKLLKNRFISSEVKTA
jgi:hypothetical protein